MTENAHFWPDHTALIAELRERAEMRARTIDPYDWQKRVTDLCEARAADALEAERKVRIEEYAIAKHLRAEAIAAKERECIAIAETLYVGGVIHPVGIRHADALDVLTALRALSHPTTEPAKAEEQR